MTRIFLLVLALGTFSFGDEGEDSPLGKFSWRQIGPAIMGGRITDIAVFEKKPQLFYVAAASGGVWKTVNYGTTWTPVFDRYGTSSIGDIALGQANPDLVWVGTGEANARNSVTHGDGVYKSIDGGKSFQNMGLKETRFIGRVLIDPENPETVYVAALGNIYVPSEHRGLYRTRDGGKSWKKILYIDENVGIVDLAMDPTDTETLFATAYFVRRDGFSSSGTPSRFDEKAGLYRSRDGGDNWERLTDGLPTGGIGRGGVDVYRKNPKIVYAILETKASNRGKSRAYLGIQGEDEERGVRITQVLGGSAAEKGGIRTDDVILAFGGKEIRSLRNLVDEIRRRKVGEKVGVTVLRDGEKIVLKVTLGKRNGELFWDQVSLSGMDVNEGGVFRSDDAGDTWTHLSTINPRPFYYSQIRIDPRNADRVYVLGTRLNVSSDGGRRFRTDGARGVHVDHHALWIDPRDPDRLLLGCDGGVNISYDRGRNWEHLNNLPIGQFYSIGVDMREPFRVYGGLQDNGTWGGPSRTRESYITNEHWTFVTGGDGFFCRVDPDDPDTLYCESQYGVAVRINRRTGARRNIRPKGRGLRFEWNTPLELSPLDSKRIYIGAQRLFESGDRGGLWKTVSPNLTATSKGSISAIGLSPVDGNVLWVGTNDGAVHVSRDRGKKWDECAVPGLPKLLWVTRVEPSHREAGTAWITVEGRRKNDLRPYVFVTRDFGKSWKSLTKGLSPEEPVYVIRQDRTNPDLLFLGTERTVYASLSGGKRWTRLGDNLPVVPVHDLVIHPRDGELVAGTHGRSLWIADIRPLQQMSAALLFKRGHLFSPPDGVLWSSGKPRWFGGVKEFLGKNPPEGVDIWYYLGWDAEKIALEIRTGDGKLVRKLKAETGRGLQVSPWSLRRRRSRVSAGEYVVRLVVDGSVFERKIRVLPDPLFRTE